MAAKFEKLLTRHHTILTNDVLVSAWNDAERFERLTGFPDYVQNLEIVQGDFRFDLNWTNTVTEKYRTAPLAKFWTFIRAGEIHGEAWKTFARSLVIPDDKTQQIELFWQSIELMKNLLVFLPITHPLAKAVEQNVRTILETRRQPNQTIDELLLALSNPKQLNGPALEIGALRAIRSALDTNPNYNLDQALLAHTDAFSYLGYREPFSNGYGPDFFRDRLRQLEPETPPATSSIELSASEQEQVDLLGAFVYFRNYRTEKLYEGLYYLENLWRAISKNFDMSVEHFGCYRIQELQTLFTQGRHLAAGEIAIRQAGHAFLLHDNFISFVTGPSLGGLVGETKSEDTTQVTGMVAAAGRVTGMAKIVRSMEDLVKIEHGDILVTTMTTPNYLPAMQRAAGFVTDEGGITCHAAIVAREMAKPCIIGTKQATSIFKDGDRLLLDAHKGIVSKLSLS